MAWAPELWAGVRCAGRGAGSVRKVAVPLAKLPEAGGRRGARGAVGPAGSETERVPIGVGPAVGSCPCRACACSLRDRGTPVSKPTSASLCFCPGQRSGLVRGAGSQLMVRSEKLFGPEALRSGSRAPQVSRPSGEAWGRPEKGGRERGSAELQEICAGKVCTGKGDPPCPPHTVTYSHFHSNTCSLSHSFSLVVSRVTDHGLLWTLPSDPCNNFPCLVGPFYDGK